MTSPVDVDMVLPSGSMVLIVVPVLTSTPRSSMNLSSARVKAPVPDLG